MDAAEAAINCTYYTLDLKGSQKQGRSSMFSESNILMMGPCSSYHTGNGICSTLFFTPSVTRKYCGIPTLIEKVNSFFSFFRCRKYLKGPSGGYGKTWGGFHLFSFKILFKAHVVKEYPEKLVPYFGNHYNLVQLWIISDKINLFQLLVMYSTGRCVN